jgi:hypothetical protein
MGAPDSAAAGRAVLACTHCGRPVCETQHTRTGYRVDYYSMHCGPVEAVTLAADDERPALTFQKLLSAMEIVTCADCYRDPSVQAERNRQFWPERAVDDQAVTG